MTVRSGLLPDGERPWKSAYRRYCDLESNEIIAWGYK